MESCCSVKREAITLFTNECFTWSVFLCGTWNGHLSEIFSVSNTTFCHCRLLLHWWRWGLMRRRWWMRWGWITTNRTLRWVHKITQTHTRVESQSSITTKNKLTHSANLRKYFNSLLSKLPLGGFWKLFHVNCIILLSVKSHSWGHALHRATFRQSLDTSIKMSTTSQKFGHISSCNLFSSSQLFTLRLEIIV